MKYLIIVPIIIGLVVHTSFSFPEKSALYKKASSNNNVVIMSKTTIVDLPDELKDEIEMTVSEIISKYNYPVETHTVTTADGYILTLHRITGSKSNRNATKGAVLVMHGLVASSADWIISGPQQGFGYMLADAGYDVWLGNARGNRYGRNHTHLDVASKEFWDFSYHEIAMHDLPTMIDYIIKTTGEDKILNIAHSQGTTIFYAMCSERPEYNQKIRAHFSLAPVAYVKHIKSPVLKLLAISDGILDKLVHLIGLNEILPKDGVISKLGQFICDLHQLTESICENILFSICGFDSQQLNTTMLPLILAHVPAGSSTKQFLHFAQEINSGKFRQYDYGFFGNLKHYKRWNPPDYDLKKIKVPIYLHHGDNDWIATPKDVRKLAKQIESVHGVFMVNDKHFNHLDFLFGTKAPKLLYNKILSLMDRYN